MRNKIQTNLKKYFIYSKSLRDRNWYGWRVIFAADMKSAIISYSRQKKLTDPRRIKKTKKVKKYTYFHAKHGAPGYFSSYTRMYRIQEIN